MQYENYMRVLKLNDYRRNKVLERHQEMGEKFEEKKRNLERMQSLVINKGVNEKEYSEEVTTILGRMKMTNPHNDKQRSKLYKAMTILDGKLDLKIGLESPKQKPPKDQ